MARRQYRFQVFRFDPEKEEHPYFSSYSLEMDESQTVLGALMEIQDRLDSSLAFRYSCRGAVCGSCGLTVNGSLVLACRTLLSRLPRGIITVEPLPNLEIEKDLVVDMSPFWRAYQEVRPWLHSLDLAPDREYRVSERERSRIDRFVNCILCACCYGACPAVSQHPDYLGPAALAKLYRFVGDTRDRRGYEHLRRADGPQGAWGCHDVFRCTKVCPKEVRPSDGIAALRLRMIASRLRRKA
jgi:succinate dehydrogenase/fumarate reductase iron-sulfur protein